MSDQIEAEFGAGFEQTIEIFFETNEVGINRRRFGHHVQKHHRAADRGRDFAGQLDRVIDVFFSARANEEALEAFAIANRD